MGEASELQKSVLHHSQGGRFEDEFQNAEEDYQEVLWPPFHSSS